MAALSMGKKGPKSVPKASARPSFIMGSRPTSLRAPLPGAEGPRIKPMEGQTQYGKPAAPSGVAGFAPEQGPT